MKKEFDVEMVLGFLSELAQNNNREWFGKNKERYLRVKEEIERITERLIAEVAAFDPTATHLSPADCLYRIYRDTRFSPDKTPYKTHIGIYINPPYGKKAPGAGYYLHFEPGNNLVAGGAWCPDAAQLKAIRTDIFENVDEYLGILNEPDFKRYFKTVGEDLLKTAPKGFPKDWEHIALLRPRNYTAYSPLTDRQATGSKMIEEVAARMQALYPFNRFLNYTLIPEED